MDTSLVLVKNTEIYAKSVTIKAVKNGKDNTTLIIEFVVASEPPHDPGDPYSQYEKENKREFHLVDTGIGITSDYYNVNTFTSDSDFGTKFRIEAKITSKIPGTGAKVAELSNQPLNQK